jgi:cation diffusion facilitator CzcD-associated flavoprotein CzcO
MGALVVGTAASAVGLCVVVLALCVAVLAMVGLNSWAAGVTAVGVEVVIRLQLDKMKTETIKNKRFTIFIVVFSRRLVYMNFYFMSK